MQNENNKILQTCQWLSHISSNLHYAYPLPVCYIPLSRVSSMTIFVNIVYRFLCQLQTGPLLFRISCFFIVYCVCPWPSWLTLKTHHALQNDFMQRHGTDGFYCFYLDLFSIFISHKIYIFFSEIQLSKLFPLKYIFRMYFPSHSKRCLLQNQELKKTIIFLNMTFL